MGHSQNERHVAVSAGIRRLPVYMLLDRSQSMQGAPIEAVQLGLEQFVTETRRDAFAKQTVHVGVITFGSRAEMVTNGLVHISKFQPPQLKVSGKTRLGGALTLLQQSIDRDVVAPTPGGPKGDWKPIVFILTDGEPTDDWQTPRNEILYRTQRKILHVVTVGCGPYINETTLRAIAVGGTFKMDGSSESFRQYFQWITQTITSASRVLSQPGADSQKVDIPPPRSDTFNQLV